MVEITTGYGRLGMIVAGATAAACVLIFILAMTAAWSSRPFRRRAAAAVLRQILEFLRKPRS